MFEILLCIFLVDTFIPLISFIYGYINGNRLKIYNIVYLSDKKLFNNYLLSIPNFQNPFLTNGYIFKIIYSNFYHLYLINKYSRIDDNIKKL